MRWWKPGVAMISALARWSVSTIGGRRAGRRHEADARADLEAGKGLGHGRHVRQRGDAPGSGRGEREQLALPDQRQQRVDRADEHVDAPGQQIRDRGGGAAERHVDEIDPGLHLEQLGAEVLRRADADRAVGQSAPAQPWPSAMNSFTVRAGTVGGTTMTKGTSATRLIGANSVSGLKHRVARQVRRDGERHRRDQQRCSRPAATSRPGNRRWCRRRRAGSRPQRSGSSAPGSRRRARAPPRRWSRPA